MKNLEFRIKNEKIKDVRCQSCFSILNSQFLIYCASVLLCSNVMADSLKFKFAPGDKYSLVTVTEQRASRVVDGNEQASEQTMRLECDLDIEEVDESGCAWAKYTYKRVVMKLRSQGQKADFDSDVTRMKTPLQAVPLRLAMGEGLYLRITPQGRIEKINGLQALITSARVKMGNVANADRVNQGLIQLFAEPAVRRELENQLRIFPEPNEGGTTWSRTEILSSTEAGYARVEQIEDVNLVFEKTFRLNPDKSGRGGVAVVDVNLVIKSVSAPVLSTSASESSVRGNLEISGGMTGQIEIEEATGRIISSKTVQDTAERAIYVAQGAMLRPPPATEPITMHVVTTFQMTKIEGAKPIPPADANEKGAPST
jgi:hypothetical protein